METVDEAMVAVFWFVCILGKRKMLVKSMDETQRDPKRGYVMVCGFGEVICESR